MIIETISETKFMDAFYNAGRGNQFSYDALECLYQYYDELNINGGEPWELDVIEVCSSWTESTPENFIKNNGIELEEGQSIHDIVTSKLLSSTIFFELDNGSFLFLNY